jgi:hypothetical protein
MGIPITCQCHFRNTLLDQLSWYIPWHSSVQPEKRRDGRACLKTGHTSFLSYPCQFIIVPRLITRYIIPSVDKALYKKRVTNFRSSVIYIFTYVAYLTYESHREALRRVTNYSEVRHWFCLSAINLCYVTLPLFCITLIFKCSYAYLWKNCDATGYLTSATLRQQGSCRKLWRYFRRKNADDIRN